VRQGHRAGCSQIGRDWIQTQQRQSYGCALALILPLLNPKTDREMSYQPARDDCRVEPEDRQAIIPCDCMGGLAHLWCGCALCARAQDTGNRGRWPSTQRAGRGAGSQGAVRHSPGVLLLTSWLTTLPAQHRPPTIYLLLRNQAPIDDR
jgi:hypothetical protein